MSDYTNPRLDAVDERLALLTQVMLDQQTQSATHRLESHERMTRIEEAIARTETIVQQIGERTNARLTQYDHKLDDHDLRVEAMEAAQEKHDARMAKLEEIQIDVKSMLAMLTRRFSGEPHE